MRLPPEIDWLKPSLSKRQANSDTGNVVVYACVGAVILFAIVLFLYSYLQPRGRMARFSPLQNGWQFWRPRPKSYGQLSSHDHSRGQSLTHLARDRSSLAAEANARNDPATGVDRNTSVRSVMTLPAYSQKPNESEQIIGREGERSGMDTVVEFPETVDEEETRRDGEMESLYQIRLARRREVAERDRHREERRQAREMYDWARLEELRLQSRHRADSANDFSGSDVSAATMLAEHQSRGRERRVSSVSYADVGQVRHDGSRIRADSQESERGGLLDGSAPMGGNLGRGRAASGTSSFFSALRTRHRSNSSLSVSTVATDADAGQSPQMTPPSASGGFRSTLGRTSLSGSDSVGNGAAELSPAVEGFNTSDLRSGSHDIGESLIPEPQVAAASSSPQPPTYTSEWGEAPAYSASISERDNATASDLHGHESTQRGSDSTSRTTDGMPTRIPSRAPRLPQLRALPSINVEEATEPNTPLSPVHRFDNAAGD